MAGTERALPLGLTDTRGAAAEEGRPLLSAPTEGQGIVADYAALGLTLGRHPLALLRERLRAWALLSAGELQSAQHGARVRTAGIVLMRQRPATASGVTFLTLEDESGQVNVIVWERVGRAQRRRSSSHGCWKCTASCSSRTASRTSSPAGSSIARGCWASC